MRYGCVITPDQIRAAITAGFDYVELPAWSLDPEGRSGLGLGRVGRALARAGHPIKVEVFSGLLPEDLAVVGPGVDQERLRRYLHRVFTDMWALGGVLVVLGIGPSRHIPEGFPRAQAEAQFAQALAMIEEESGRNGLELALEPLNRAETNLLNTLDESCRFLANYNIPDVRLLADIYHLTVEDEPLESLISCGSRIAHVHVADGERLPPGQGGFDFGPFFAALRQAGYDERISIKCDWRDFEGEAAAVLAYIKERWEASALEREWD